MIHFKALLTFFRVADYGFTKLIELFEAIPGTIEITEDADGERILQLTDSERLNVVGDHISFLIKNSAHVNKGRGHHHRNFPGNPLATLASTTQPQTIKLNDLPQMYLRQYGYALRPENFGESSLKGIIEKMSSSLRLDEPSDENDDISVRLIDKSFIRILSNR